MPRCTKLQYKKFDATMHDWILNFIERICGCDNIENADAHFFPDKALDNIWKTMRSFNMLVIITPPSLCDRGMQFSKSKFDSGTERLKYEIGLNVASGPSVSSE